MKCFFNGTLYVRIKTPTKKIVKITSKGENHTFIYKKTNERITLDNEEKLSTLPFFALKMLENEGLIKVSKEEDLESIGLYQLFILKDKKVIINKQNNTLDQIISVDLEKNFMSLEDFMAESKPIMKALNPSIHILYECASIYLIRNIYENKYYFISKKDYEALPNKVPLEECYEKDQVYKDIISSEIHVKEKGR